MTIICTVAADFVRADGEKFSITGKEIGIIKEAPEWIKDTLMFKWLDRDGSVKYVTRDNRILAENDPLAGINAEGKLIREEEPKAEETPVEEQETASEEQPKKKTTRKKTEKKGDA